MELRFCIQDPTHAQTTYLYEAILRAAVHAAGWRGVYAFASRDGVDQLIGDPVVRDYMRAGGEIDLLVGIDAVTNRPTLERLRELERRNARFRPRVFWNESRGLFHPKISDFHYSDGRRTLIVGSGNLTRGGLMNNFEGYTVVSAAGSEELDVSALDELLARHAENIRTIDDDALERAARNWVRPVQNARRTGGGLVAPRPGRGARAAAARVLIARVPGAGGRWSQVHFNADVVREFFRVTDRHTQRVFLTRVASNGDRGEVEVRPCVFSERNRNHKMEIRAATGLEYPEGGAPILAFRERQLRTFDYMLFMPDEEGYGALMELTERLPALGRGLRRVITEVNTLAGVWSTCPLLATADADEQEV